MPSRLRCNRPPFSSVSTRRLAVRQRTIFFPVTLSDRTLVKQRVTSWYFGVVQEAIWESMLGLA